MLLCDSILLYDSIRCYILLRDATWCRVAHDSRRRCATMLCYAILRAIPPYHMNEIVSRGVARPGATLRGNLQLLCDSMRFAFSLRAPTLSLSDVHGCARHGGAAGQRGHKTVH